MRPSGCGICVGREVPLSTLLARLAADGVLTLHGLCDLAPFFQAELLFQVLEDLVLGLGPRATLRHRWEIILSTK